MHIQAWITCPLAGDAPVNDLLLYNRIQQYVKTVSDAAMKKLQNHFWYFGCIHRVSEKKHPFILLAIS